MGMSSAQCKVLYVDNSPNPSFGPFPQPTYPLFWGMPGGREQDWA